MGCSPTPFHLNTLTFRRVSNLTKQFNKVTIQTAAFYLPIQRLGFYYQRCLWSKNLTNMQYFDCEFKRQPFSGTVTFKTVEPFFQWIGVQPHVLWLYEPLHVPGSIVCGKRLGWDLSLLPSDSCRLSRERSQESNNNSDKQPFWKRLFSLPLSL